jgi:hypothetical protein
VIGFGVSKTLSPSIQVVPGTQSSRAQQLASAQFGPTPLVPILLEGPRAKLNAEGPKLVVALTKRSHTLVLSAWDAGTASAGLRPRRTAAMIVVSVDRPEREVVRYEQLQIEKLVSAQISRPVRTFIAGQPSLDRALKDASLSNLRRDERFAAGILFLLLLVGLRAPIAALIVSPGRSFSPPPPRCSDALAGGRPHRGRARPIPTNTVAAAPGGRICPTGVRPAHD